MDKNIKKGNQKLIAGVNKLADIVKVTMGGAGRLVIIEDYSGREPIVTKDGVTVAKFVDLQDSYENLGATLMKQASQKALQESADSTTTATVLAQALINEGVNSNKSYKQLHAEYDQSLLETTKQLKKLSKKGNHMFNVAKTSANGDNEVAKIVTEAFKLTNNVFTETAEETELVYQPGEQIKNGWAHEALITNKDKKQFEANNVLTLIYKDNLKNLDPINDILEYCAANKKPLLIIVEDFEDFALKQLAFNHIQNLVTVCLVRAPFDFDFDKYNYSTEFVSNEPFETEKVIITNSDTFLIGNGGEGVATIKVGGTTHAETVEKLDRVDDAIGSVKSSKKLGVIPGGGTTLTQIKNISPEFEKALMSPMITILENADMIYQNVPYNEGFNVVTGEYVKDMLKAGIVDSTESIIKALEAATSVAKVVLQTNGLILTNNETNL